MLTIDDVHALYGEDMAMWYDALIFDGNTDHFNLIQDLFMRIEGWHWLVLKANEYRLYSDMEWRQRQMRMMF